MEPSTSAERLNSMRSSIASFAALVLIVAACGGETAAPETTTSTTAPATTVTTVPTTTTTTEASTTTTTAPPAETQLPATWVGVTEDYEAVEVDTETGEVLSSIAQVSTAEDVETAECAACINAVDAVWRSYDGSHFYVSECCEPAAGMIHVLTPDDLPYLPGDDAPTWTFWTASPSPDFDEVVFVGYQVVVTEPTVDPGTARPGVDYTMGWANEGDLFPISNAVWDGDRIKWLEGGTEGVRIRVFQLDGPTSVVEVPDLDGWNSANLAIRGAGELVVARAPFDEPATEALVIDQSGTVVEHFPLEPGSRLGNYDSSGTFLIYVDGDGIVRWLGGGESGVLAEGFLQASW